MRCSTLSLETIVNKLCPRGNVLQIAVNFLNLELINLGTQVTNNRLLVETDTSRPRPAQFKIITLRGAMQNREGICVFPSFTCHLIPYRMMKRMKRNYAHAPVFLKSNCV